MRPPEIARLIMWRHAAPQREFLDVPAARFYDQGAEPIGSNSEEFKIFIAAEYRRRGKPIRTVGSKAK